MPIWSSAAAVEFPHAAAAVGFPHAFSHPHANRPVDLRAGPSGVRRLCMPMCSWLVLPGASGALDLFYRKVEHEHAQLSKDYYFFTT